MMRLNLLLLVAVLGSAFGLVHIQYESRRLYTAIDKAQSQAQRLEADHEQLKVHKRERATSARVQQVAGGQLQMRPAHPGITQYVAPPASAPAAAPTPVEARP